MQLKTIIVEDEPLSRLYLQNLLREYCPQAEVVATAATEDGAVSSIEQHRPDIVFMDIELQQGNGFNVLKRTRNHHYKIVFTTALEHEGLLSIKFSGVDYLQKPIDMEALQKITEDIQVKENLEHKKLAVQHLLHTLDNNNIPGALLLNGTEEKVYVDPADIISAEAEGDNLVFETTHRKITVNGKSIKEYEQLLSGFNFFRTHNCCLINLSMVENYTGNDTVLMKKGGQVAVSAKKFSELKSRLSF
jgi:two-component system, LytTR family, response regulator